MPIKRAPQKTDGVDNENGAAHDRMPLAYQVIIVVIILFGINVGYEVYEDMSNKFSVTDSQSKTCMVDFQKSSCNPLSLSESCERLFECVQQDSNEPLLTKGMSFVNFFIEEIQ
jgi:hypothetical protein